jgi:23S rRNA (adenine2503-C2)-methyltransferase
VDPRAGLLPADVARRFGTTEEVGRKVLSAVVQRGERDLAGVRGVKKTLLQQIERETSCEPLEIAERIVAPDGFVKYLYKLHDGARVESVRIPVPCEAEGADLSAYEGKEKKYIVCVSSQVGCALACSFCSTGALGFKRNLSAAEIVQQILAIKNEPELDRPVRGVVFMGMGEPFLNFDNVIQAAKILCHPAGGCIDASKITISTAGIVPQIRRYTAEGHKFRLAVSLTQATPQKRLPLMPIERTHPTEDLVAALHDHARTRKTRVLVEYVLMAGVNDSVEDARALARLLDRKCVIVDLIDVNPGFGNYSRSTRAQRSAFLDVLAEAKMPFAIRYSGGQDVAAGCGQLAAGGGRIGRKVAMNTWPGSGVRGSTKRP